MRLWKLIQSIAILTIVLYCLFLAVLSKAVLRFNLKVQFIYLIKSINFSLAKLNQVMAYSLKFKEALSCDLAIASSLMLTVVISKNSQSIAQTCQTSSKYSKCVICNDFNVVEIWKSYLQVFDELLICVRKRGSRKYSLKIGKIVICMETVPMDLIVHYEATCYKVLSKSLMINSILF
jgi:hypothetical protein